MSELDNELPRRARRSNNRPRRHEPAHLLESHDDFESRRVSLALRALGLSLLALVVLLWTVVYQLLVVDVSIPLPAGVSNEAFETAIYEIDRGRMLQVPTAIEVSADGDIYVLDSGSKSIHVYDSQYRYIRSYGDKVAEKYRLKQPVSLAVASTGQSYVVDSALKQLLIYDAEGKPTRAVTFKEEQPLAVSVGANESGQEILYVTTKSGVALGSLNGAFYAGRFNWGRQPGQFDAPVDVSVYRQGDNPVLYIADSLNYRIQAMSGFETTPTVLWTYGGPLEGDALRNQSASRKFGLPVGVEVGAEGNLYVLDGLSGQVVVLDRETGRLTDALSNMGQRDGELLYPEGLAVQGGKIYVADTDNARISVFSEGGLITPSKDTETPTAHVGWILSMILAVVAVAQITHMVMMRSRWIIVGPDVLNRLDSLDFAKEFVHFSDTVVIPLSQGSLASIVPEPLSVRVQAIRPRVVTRVASALGEEYESGQIELIALAKSHHNCLIVTDDATLAQAAQQAKVWTVGTKSVLGRGQQSEN